LNQSGDVRVGRQRRRVRRFVGGRRRRDTQIPIVLAVTFLAAYLPARRASRVNPVQALRYE